MFIVQNRMKFPVWKQLWALELHQKRLLLAEKKNPHCFAFVISWCFILALTYSPESFCPALHRGAVSQPLLLYTNRLPISEGLQKGTPESQLLSLFPSTQHIFVPTALSPADPSLPPGDKAGCENGFSQEGKFLQQWGTASKPREPCRICQLGRG